MDTNRSPHVALSLRLKPSLGLLLEDTSKKMGISKTAVLAVALRELAKKEGVEEREITDNGK